VPSGKLYCHMPVNCTEEPSLNWIEPLRWYPGMVREFPEEGAHETFTKPPAGTLLCFGVRTPGSPFMVQPVASTLPPEFTNEITHVP
jgi:hypothetical protein